MINKVSVVIPNYHHAAFLKQRIDSVLNQTLKPFEIIILDDCSTDSSVNIIQQYVLAYPQIQFVQNTINSGSTFSQWNKAVQLAKGNLIWIAESDDVAEPTFLEKLIRPFDTNNNLALAFCQSNRMDAAGNIVGTWINHTEEFKTALFNNNFEMKGVDFIENFLIHKNCIPNASAVVFKKEFYNLSGGAAATLKSHGDWLVWLSILSNGDVGFISEPLNNFRFHTNSVIAKSLAANKDNTFKDWYGLDMRKYYSKYLKTNSNKFLVKVKLINSQYISIDTGNLGLYLLKQKQYFKACKLILQASFSPNFKSGFLKKAIFGK